MRYLSVCSGIEAATVAWHPLGWKPAGFSEIEHFPSAVLAHHYPDTPNFGDMTSHATWNIGCGSVDVLVGGTPCQSFSVAGLRKGMADPRGNLALTYLAIADRLRPRWLVFENVPGLLSSGSGRDFGAFLGALAQLGYGWAYRVLDAQYFGVAQRRRRVFVVGYAGDWRRAAAVLFESSRMLGDTPPSRKAAEATASNAQGGARASGQFWNGEQVAGTVTASSNDQFMPDCGQMQAVVGALCARGPQAMGRAQVDAQQFVAQPVPYDLFQITAPINRQNRQPGDPCHTLARDNAAHAAIAIQGNLIGRDEGGPHGVGASDDGVMYTLTKADTHAVAHAFYSTGGTHGVNQHEEVSPAVKVGSGLGIPSPPAVAHSIRTSQTTGNGHGVQQEVTPTLDTANGLAVSHVMAWDEQLNARPDIAGPMLRGGQGGRHDGVMTSPMVVRRLTPVECERLQGFPDGYTQIPYRGKEREACPDGPRYKALGNSMAVPVMRWIGERIAQVDQISVMEAANVQ
jgi:DNA (cytosine-5)-methyltransferase 1